MRVLEIFYSIDGEGRRAGELTVFVRLAGCNLQCAWCDTAYSQSIDAGQEMTIEEILFKIDSYNCKNITITGGEPLIHKDIDVLLYNLSFLGYDVNVETNGTVAIDKYLKKEYKNVWFTMDYKTASSGMNDKMQDKNYLKLRQQDVLKIVVGSEEDLKQALMVIADSQKKKYLIYLSPVFEMIEPVRIVEFMKEYSLQGVRVQLQLHKFIWDKNERCV